MVDWPGMRNSLLQNALYDGARALVLKALGAGMIAVIVAAISLALHRPIEWLHLLGIFLVLSLIFIFLWPRRAKLRKNQSHETLPGTPGMRFDRPVALPVEYKKGPDGIASGLYVRSGYDAINVHIPKVPVGASVYMLTFPDTLPLVCERDNNPYRFLEGLLEDQTDTLLGGGNLREVMRKANVEVIKFGIVYQGTDFLTYRTNCVFKRTPKGIGVEAISQELLPKPPD